MAERVRIENVIGREEMIEPNVVLCKSYSSCSWMTMPID